MCVCIHIDDISQDDIIYKYDICIRMDIYIQIHIHDNEFNMHPNEIWY